MDLVYKYKDNKDIYTNIHDTNDITYLSKKVLPHFNMIKFREVISKFNIREYEYNSDSINKEEIKFKIAVGKKKRKLIHHYIKFISYTKDEGLVFTLQNRIHTSLVYNVVVSPNYLKNIFDNIKNIESYKKEKNDRTCIINDSKVVKYIDSSKYTNTPYMDDIESLVRIAKSFSIVMYYKNIDSDELCIKGFKKTIIHNIKYRSNIDPSKSITYDQVSIKRYNTTNILLKFFVNLDDETKKERFNFIIDRDTLLSIDNKGDNNL